jgi:hypothetical protein
MGGERIVQRRLLFDEYARIPFSVIGVFIILGSSITAVYISRLELQKSHEIARSLDLSEVENLLYYFEADLSTALNIAGMKAFKEIGKSPVITSSIGVADEINQNRIKEIIKDELNLYLTGNYLDNMFSDGRYVINVVLHNENPIFSIENISFEPVSMQLQRITIPFIGPRETNNHSSYWVAAVPLTIEIRTVNDNDWELLATRTIVVSSLLTSRYPLLESLVNDYHQTINGTFSPLWTFTTVFSNLYSLVRGFKHYRCGKPFNVMDNRHLSVIINSGLLLEQSLVFGSVDPLGLVELARKTKQVLKQTSPDPLTIFNNEMKGEGYHVDTENISEGSANVDAGFPINESIGQCPSLNLSEIAERILYNISSVTLHFANEAEDSYEELIIFDDDIQAKINDIVQRLANQSFFLTTITKHLSTNATTLQKLKTIISEMYQDTMSTKVFDRFIVAEQWGNPGDGWMDGGATIWNAVHVVALSKKLIKPSKGCITPGCGLYEEEYNVSYERVHYWWQIEEHTINGTVIQVKVWNNVTDLLIETVVLQSLLQHYTKYQESQDDIVDVLYVNETINDQNLEDTLNNYLALHNDSEPEKQELITTQNNIGSIGLEAELPGSYSEWVLEEAWGSLDEILGLIRDITLSPGINTTRFPNPVHLIENAKDDLLAQYNTHISEYLNFSRYHPGPEFCSVGKKAVYFSREWYVGFMKNMTEAVFSQISNQLINALDTAILPYADFTTDTITKSVDDASDALQNQFTIPFGYDMDLTRYTEKGTPLWNETVRLAVDQYPNYLDPFEKTLWGNEELWTLKIRNRCLFGPTGLPILPLTPVTPWLLTINCWVLDVQGEYAQFKIIDTSDETIFNPLLGHEPQSYVRELHIITVLNRTLGENTRLSFGFTTVSFGLVPPWGMMVGDIQENWFDDHTLGFDEEG